MLRSNDTYVFGDFRLDLAEKVLLQNGKAVPLTPKVFETLQFFVENAGHLIKKDELMQRLWQDRFVEESNLTFNIKMLRKALGDSASKPKFIETVQRRGYRFIAETQLVKKDEMKNGLSSVSPSKLIPVYSSMRPVPQMAAVVALADWRPETNTYTPEESSTTVAKPELALVRPVIESRSKYIVFASAVLVLCAIGLSYYFLYTGGEREAIDSVAVLPFVNATGDINAEYLSEGISDSIINGLSRLPNLKVNSLNSVMRYKGKEVAAQTVGRELNVRAVMIGTFAQQGESLSITVELIDVRDNSRLWGEQYSRQLSDLLGIQSEIARRVSDGLRLRLTGDEKKRLTTPHTENNEAYLQYSLGKYYHRQNTKEGFEKAIQSFEEATRLDPNYAQAYIALGNTYQFTMSRNFLPPKEYAQKVEWAALKALQIDDSLAEAHASLASYRLIGFDWEGAEKELRRALDLDPKSVYANSVYSHYLLGLGRADEALDFAKRARELDSTPGSGEDAFFHYMARQYDKAIGLYRKTLEKNPDNAHPHVLLGEAYVANGMPSEGVAEIQKGIALDASLKKTPGRWDRYPLLSSAYAANGQRDEALKILEDQQALARQGYVSPYTFAIIYTALGDKDRAFEHLAKCIDERIMIIYHLKSRPIFDSLRSDPRYVELLRKMNLTP